MKKKKFGICMGVLLVVISCGVASCDSGMLPIDPMQNGDYGIDSVTSTQARLYWQTDRVTSGVVAWAWDQFSYYSKSAGIRQSDYVSNLVLDENKYLLDGDVKSLGGAGQAIEYTGLNASNDDAAIQLSPYYTSPNQYLDITGLTPDTWYVVNLQFWLQDAWGTGSTAWKFLVFKTAAQ